MVEIRDEFLSEEDLPLALEVVVERRLGDAESLRDLPKRRPLVSLLVEQLERHVEDPFPRRLASAPWRAFAR